MTSERDDDQTTAQSGGNLDDLEGQGGIGTGSPLSPHGEAGA